MENNQQTCPCCGRRGGCGCSLRARRHLGEASAAEGAVPYTPSIYGHILGGTLFLFSVALLIFNARAVRSMPLYMILVVCLLFSLAVSLHGISHLFLEREYGYFYIWPWVLREPLYQVWLPTQRRAAAAPAG